MSRTMGYDQSVPFFTPAVSFKPKDNYNNTKSLILENCRHPENCARASVKAWLTASAACCAAGCMAGEDS